MTLRASRLGMGVARFSRPLRGVGVIAMRKAGLDTMLHVEVLQGAGVLRLHLTGMGVGVFIDRRCLADRVEVMC